MRKFLFFFLIVSSTTVVSQVGLGTTTPQSSLDIYQQSGNLPQGLLLPRLSGDFLRI